MAVALNLCLFVPLAGCVGGGRHTVTPNNSSLSAIDTAQALALQSAVMSMSDDWNSALGAMAFEMQRACGSDMQCMWVTQAFLRNGMGASLDVAVGPNPSVAIMDMLVLCSLETWALEHHWAGVGIPLEAGLAGAKQLANARDALWEQAADHLKVAELARLRALVDAWIARHPDQSIVSFVRLADFASDRNQLTLAERADAGGLLEELNEVSVAVDDARLLGERALWYSSRYPYVLGQQAEMTALRLTQSISIQVAAQREAILGGVAKEREAIISSLSEQERTLTPVLAEARGTIAEARALSAELQKVIAAIDGLVARFDNTPSEGKSLTIADLQSLVREAGTSATEARKLIEASSGLVQSDRLPAAAASVDRVARDLVDRVLWGAAGIVVLLVGGLALVRRVPQSASQPAKHNV
ncbi:MAG: hypothetical protein P3A30_03430 [Gemmatimonadota bacterium]|nr:hypothetical protein [Gemmatimonadota bacterium]